MLVAMNRRICVELYDEITKLKPKWHGDEDDRGTIKAVMTGSASDPNKWQPHIRNAGRRKRIEDKLKDSDHELKFIIVRDMLETTTRKYTNRRIEATEAIEELIEFGKKVREEKSRGNLLKYC